MLFLPVLFSTITFACISWWLPSWCLWSYLHLIHLPPWFCACGQLEALPILHLLSDLFLLWNLIWGNSSLLSICCVPISSQTKSSISKESSLRNKMCWRMVKHSILQWCSKSQEVNNSIVSGYPWNWPDSLEPPTRISTNVWETFSDRPGCL